MSATAELALGAMELLEQSVNAALRLDPLGAEKLGRFTGKVIAVDVQDSPVTVYCLPGAGSLMLLAGYSGNPDTTLRGRPLALLELVAGDSRRVLLAGEVTIEGDVELGRQFKQVLDGLHIDWEEAVSRITGDVLAHKAGHLLREVGSWWTSIRERHSANAAEYFQQEMWVLPTRAEVEKFYQQVEILRDDVARLAARLEQLEPGQS